MIFVVVAVLEINLGSLSNNPSLLTIQISITRIYVYYVCAIGGYLKSNVSKSVHSSGDC